MATSQATPNVSMPMPATNATTISGSTSGSRPSTSRTGTSNSVAIVPTSSGRGHRVRNAMSPPTNMPAVCAARTNPHAARPMVSSATIGPSVEKAHAVAALTKAY
jgi:hypothetical protein